MRNAFALAVGLGGSDKFGFERGDIDRLSHASELVIQIKSLLNEVHACERVGSDELLFNCGEAPGNGFGCSLAATLWSIRSDRFEVRTN